MIYKAKEINQNLVNQLKVLFNCDDFLARLLASKNYSASEAFKLFHLESAILPTNIITNMKEASEKIIQFIKNEPNGRIIIYSDYDVDGITSTFILKYALESITAILQPSFKIQSYLPERSEGYGINETFCNSIDNNVPTFIVTVDNGTNACKAIDVLNKRNIPVVVTDHHQPEDITADCLIVNPCFNNDEEQKHLAGCGVAFKLGISLQESLGFNSMLEVIDLLCLGTIGDMMPMTLENMAFCYYGISRINSDSCNDAIKFLKSSDIISYKDISFDIVPKINSCGRMGEMGLAKEYFIHPTFEAAEQITLLNEERKAKVKQCMKLVEDNNSHVVIFENENISGIGGIIAGQLSLKNRQNTIVLSKIQGTTIYKGSARNYDSNVLEDIQSFCSEFETLKASGHEEACGVQIDEIELYAFQKAFDQYYNRIISSSDALLGIEESVHEVDMMIDFEEINMKNLNIIRNFPYDKKLFTEPVFLINANLIEKTPTKTNPSNIWITLEKNNKKMRIWAQDLTEKVTQLKSKNNLNIIATIEKDFIKENNVTLKVIDIYE